jgi:hypothetical protein
MIVDDAALHTMSAYDAAHRRVIVRNRTLRVKPTTSRGFQNALDESTGYEES